MLGVGGRGAFRPVSLNVWPFMSCRLSAAPVLPYKPVLNRPALPCVCGAAFLIRSIVRRRFHHLERDDPRNTGNFRHPVSARFGPGDPVRDPVDHEEQPKGTAAAWLVLDARLATGLNRNLHARRLVMPCLLC